MKYMTAANTAETMSPTMMEDLMMNRCLRR